MNSTTKTQTSTAKFEEFFATSYKDDVFKILEKYPDDRSLTVNYQSLEMFDPELADLLIEKPEEVIQAAQIAIKNIDPLVKDADINIRFENLSNIIQLKDLLSKYIGTFVAADGIVRKTDEIRPRIETGVFECRGCMRLHEVEQTSGNHIIEPSLCSECGGRSFRLLQEEFKNYIYVNHIEPLEQEFEELHLSEEDEEKIIELSQDPHIYDKIIKSTAPSIRGYREVKEAIALQLFGGAAKQLEDETKLRGDIHILIVGDPGIGKSQILKYVSRLAPRSIYTSGKGTSGAGLTAAAVRDELGGWSLEAGALVLGDQGNVCVDELDKMRSEDRSALHEALEQQTVSIAKAGIMATLNSRCSVLAAANPKFGRFDRFKVLAEQIDLPAPIISRFDLIFVIEDKPSREKDSDLAKHILEIHKENTVNYEIEPELLRKYIAYARKNINPRLTDEANEILREFYVNTRNSNPEEQGAVPITARQLEATIRLAEASAKIKLKDKVEAEDANKAVKLTMFCLKDIGVDPETGEIDIDRIGDGTPKSDRDKIQRVTEEIALLEEEFAGDAPLNVLLSNMNEKYGVSEEKTEQIVRNLKQKGVIYEPNAGYFRRVI